MGVTMREDCCPIAEAAKLLGDKWTLIILRDLTEGPRRFSDLAGTSEHISPSVLAARLKDLESHGILSRSRYNEIPPRVDYELTLKGRDAIDVVEALRAYGAKWCMPADTSPIQQTSP